jgi:hypothetical protein
MSDRLKKGKAKTLKRKIISLSLCHSGGVLSRNPGIRFKDWMPDYESPA